MASPFEQLPRTEHGWSKKGSRENIGHQRANEHVG
jgi:hypothetical protein